MRHAPDASSETTVSYRRSPSEVMRLDRLGSFHATRLSFMQTLLRRVEREDWRFERRLWEIDENGLGRAVYTVYGPERDYSLVAFAHDLPDDMRSDRVIATAWDATFSLFDGIPDEADLQRLEANVPKQEAGRVSDNELSLSRANRSVRLFNHVVESLASGQQPDRERVESTGYLMRTTAVYGSGKFGAADRVKIADRPDVSGPFQAEMLSVWLTRAFTLDLAEHLARCRGGERATTLDPDLRRLFGVGNSTGLGMAPFLMNHPVLFNNWIAAREEAFARVRALPIAGTEEIATFRDTLQAAIRNARFWTSDHPLQQDKLAVLRRDLETITGHTTDNAAFAGDRPWDRLWHWGQQTLGLEGQEALVPLILEPHGDLIDDLTACMAADEDSEFRINGGQTVTELRDLMVRSYDWALDTDYDTPDHNARFWYVSEEKLEPRLGERHSEDGGHLEQPLATGRDAARLKTALDAWRGGDLVADFLLAHPEHRHMVRRAQIAARFPYSEIRDNLIDATMLPIDLLRCKLSFFGASRFDPRSDRWVRICMYQGATFPHELLKAPA
ncbi:MAG: hypothetical protein CMM46_17415 [Rhodospirillaceae bacterium]|nr:hypothetical protein [Rhodospirillaceae bacterium]